MSGSRLFEQIPRFAWWALIGGIALLLAAMASGAWLLGVAGLAALSPFGWSIYSAPKHTDDPEPFPWPNDLRVAAEGMARPIDPTPKRILPKDDNAPTIAEVASTKEALEHLLVDKPPLWRWAVFTSVLLQRRSAVQPRLRNCALGYQPRSGTPLGGQAYSRIAYDAMHDIADLVRQMEQFMLSPGFTGALGTAADEDSANADAIVHIANRLMDYHEEFLREAERCLQTPVETDAIVFVQDVGAFTMCPLAGYEQFIRTMCDRVAEGQELLPYAEGTVQLDDAKLTMDLPNGLMQTITAHIKRFNR